MLDESEYDSLVQSAQRFAAERLQPFAAEWDARGMFDPDVFRAAGEHGLLSMRVPQADGGLGLGILPAVLVLEALSEGCVATAGFISIQNAIGRILAQYAPESIKSAWLPSVCSGHRLGSFCLTEPGAGSDTLALQSKAVLTGNGYAISGVKQFISGAGISDFYLVFARIGPDFDKIGCFFVEQENSGLTWGPNEAKLGWRAQPTRQVILENCQVSHDSLLGKDGLRIALDALAGGRLSIAACSSGPAHAALKLALRHCKDREQFGRPLNEFQGVQLKLSDMWLKLASARNLLLEAAAKADADHPEAAMRSAMAKLAMTETGFWVVDQALQLHGGYGFFQSLPLERWLRDLRAHRIVEGTSEVMRLIVFREMQKHL